jgi:hypothetical protein
MPDNLRNPMGNLPRRDLSLGYERGMDLIVVDARTEETARAGRLAQAHGAVIEKSTQRAAPRAAGDSHDGRVFMRRLGQRGRRTQVVESHDGGSIPLSVSLGQQHPCQQRHHYRGHEGHPVPHGSSSLSSTTLGNIDSPRGRGIGENCMRRAKEETPGRTTLCTAFCASRFGKCKLFRLETWKGWGRGQTESSCQAALRSPVEVDELLERRHLIASRG